MEALHSDFNQRFEDILKMCIPNRVLDPFKNTETKTFLKLKEKLIKLTINEE